MHIPRVALLAGITVCAVPAVLADFIPSDAAYMESPTVEVGFGTLTASPIPPYPTFTTLSNGNSYVQFLQYTPSVMDVGNDIVFAFTISQPLTGTASEWDFTKFHIAGDANVPALDFGFLLAGDRVDGDNSTAALTSVSIPPNSMDQSDFIFSEDAKGAPFWLSPAGHKLESRVEAHFHIASKKAVGVGFKGDSVDSTLNPVVAAVPEPRGFILFLALVVVFMPSRWWRKGAERLLVKKTIE